MPIPVSASFIDDCKNVNHTILSNGHGYLTLHPKNPHQSFEHQQPHLCSWILVTEPGKRFNITWRLPSAALLNDPFEASSQVVGNNRGLALGDKFHGVASSASAAAATAFCGVSWKFVDSGEEIHYAACVSGLRKPQGRMYISKSNHVQIQFTGSLFTSSLLLSSKHHLRLPVLHYKGMFLLGSHCIIVEHI